MKYDVILIDGSSYLFRAYHALPPLVNAGGMPTGAIFGVLNMIKRLEKDYPDTRIIVVFDPKGGTFRNEIYDQYKAERSETPSDLAVQIPILQEVIVAMGFPLLVMPGYEADDVIASLVGIGKGDKILISTLDKDLAQLVTEKVHIINTMHNKKLDPEKVFEKFQVHPHQIKDYLALVGDRSDNIPGITGVGPKTAAKWLGLYQNIEGVKENQHLLKGKVGDTLRSEIGQLDLSYQLVSLVEDLDLGESLDLIQGKAPNISKLRKYFQELGFNRWLSELTEQKSIVSIEIRSLNAMKMVISHLTAVASISYQVSKLHNASSMLESFSLYTADKVYYFHQDNVNLTEVWEGLLGSKFLKTLVVYDAKLLLNDFARRKISPEVSLFDVMLAGYVLDSTRAQSLEKLSSLFLKDRFILHKDDEDKDILGKYVFNISRLYEVFLKRLDNQNKDIYENIEIPLMHVLAKMEQVGILVDVNSLNNYAEVLKKEVKGIEISCEDILGKAINLASPKQLAEVLFNELALPVIEKTKGGVPSTGESVLQALSNQHPIIPQILQHRTLSKILSTYAEALPKQVMEDGRIHGCFNQAVTVTGRLSSMNPNLQNIPIRTEQGRQIRKAFIPQEGKVLLAADYSQIELRIMAHISQDQGLLKAFANGEDVHAATAAKVEGVSLDKVTSDMRRRAKAVNFGLIYGMSAFGLAKQLGVSRSEASGLIEKYFKEYPGVLTYMENTRKKAEERGYVETLLGRRIMMVGAQSKQSIEKQAAMRAAINAPMQGTASDIIKLAMLAVDKNLVNYDYHLVLQVHDELIFEVDRLQVEAFKKAVKEQMETVMALDVPLIVNVAYGDDWESAHE